MFSNRLITDLNETVPSDKKILANRATQLLGLIGGVASLVGAVVASKLGRKTMTVIGYIFVSLSHFLIAHWITQHDGQYVIMSMIIL